jgi:hypothetical protein
MRPRINRTEAAYLVELLQIAQSIIEENEQYYKQLDKETYKLNKLKNIEPYTAYLAGLKEKKEALSKWQRIAWCVLSNKLTNHILIQKYKAIAEGNTHQGTYKSLNSKLSYTLIADVTTRALPDMLREPAPIWELGVKQLLCNRSETEEQ